MREYSGGRILFYAAVYLLIATQPASGKATAVVTDFFHFYRHFQPVPYYPDYFSNDREWSSELIALADSLLRNNLGIDDLSFDMPAVSFRVVRQWAVGSNIYPVNLPGMEKARDRKAAFYIAIFSTIGEGSSTTSNSSRKTNHKLLLKIRVEDKDGEVHFEKKVKVPFYAEIRNYLYGGLISSDDFKMLYEKGLTALLSTRKVKFKRQTVGRQQLSEYQTFSSKYVSYVLKERSRDRGKDGTYIVGHADDIKRDTLELATGYVNKEFTDEFFNLNLSDRLKQKNSLRSSFSEEEIRIVAGHSINEQFRYYGKSAFIIVIFYVDEKEVARYGLLEPGILVGKTEPGEYRLEFDPLIQLYTIHKQDELLALIQDGKFRKENRKGMHYYICRMHPELLYSTEQWLWNTFLAYQLATIIQEAYWDEF